MTPELTPELRGEIRQKLRAKYPEVRGWVFAAVRASNPEWDGAISLIGISDAARRLQEQIVPIRRDVFDLFNESWPSFVLAGEIPVFFHTLKEVCKWPEEVLAEAMDGNNDDDDNEDDTNPLKEHTMRNMLSPDLLDEEDEIDDDDDDADEDLGACTLPDVTRPLRTLTGIPGAVLR